MSIVHNVIILGSGPAGLTAAIYTARANLNPILFTGEQEGGQLTTTTEVENFPGFPTGILGPELMQDMKKQAERFGTKTIYSTVTKVDLSASPYKIITRTEEFLTKSIIIATGASSKYLGLPNEKSLIGHGVSTCATCDGFFFKGKDIAIIGGGDSACEEATFLTNHAKSVTLIHRRDKLRASPIMQDRILKNPKIRILWNTIIESLQETSDKKLKGLMLKNVLTQEISHFECSGLFLAIGHNPNSELFVGQLECNHEGFLVVTNGMKTNKAGIFVAGDVHDHIYKQAVTAAGMGCMAALDAQRYLDSLR